MNGHKRRSMWIQKNSSRYVSKEPHSAEYNCDTLVAMCLSVGMLVNVMQTYRKTFFTFCICRMYCAQRRLYVFWLIHASINHERLLVFELGCVVNVCDACVFKSMKRFYWCVLYLFAWAFLKCRALSSLSLGRLTPLLLFITSVQLIN